MDSKHGGSPASGIVPPAGLDTAKPALPGGLVLEPEVAKENRNAKDRALQFERRRLALAVGPAYVEYCASRWMSETPPNPVDLALAYADELLAKTGGHV